jgi:hypothetical protein
VDIVKALNPRYHFAACEGVFYEREPYRSAGAHVTRFIGLGDFCNDRKERVSILI